PYLELDPDCTDEQIQTIYVRGYNWPLNNQVKKIAIYWDEVLQDSFKPSSGTFVYQMTVNGVTEGVHTITAQTEDNQGNFVPEPDGAVDSVTFLRPCSVEPTGPTPTPLPNALPDLVIPSLQVSEYMTGELGTYETVRLQASVANQGVADVSSLFWVDLYLDPDLDRPLNEQASVDYVAINGLAADSLIYFTMYVPGENLPAPGTYSVVAVADTWEQISESDETNNLSAPLTFTVTVQNPEPTPTPTPETPPGDPGAIEGRTYIYIEDQLQSLSGVGIYVYDQEGRLMGSGFSDSSGLYQITDLPAGDYTVVGIVRMGDVLYQDQIMVTVWEGATTQGADLVLEPTY
ncbi:MAG: CARDB domain-containing protein, partial [Anaerolineales bacterium]